MENKSVLIEGSDTLKSSVSLPNNEYGSLWTLPNHLNLICHAGILYGSFNEPGETSCYGLHYNGKIRMDEMKGAV